MAPTCMRSCGGDVKSYIIFWPSVDLPASGSPKYYIAVDFWHEFFEKEALQSWYLQEPEGPGWDVKRIQRHALADLILSRHYF